MTAERVFADTSVLIRYFAEDDVPRALAAATLLGSGARIVISTGVILEALYVLRTEYGFQNPKLALLLVKLLTHTHVELADADQFTLAQAIAATRHVSARHIADAILAGAAQSAQCDYIASFDEKMTSSTVAVRLL